MKIKEIKKIVEQAFKKYTNELYVYEEIKLKCTDIKFITEICRDVDLSDNMQMESIVCKYSVDGFEFFVMREEWGVGNYSQGTRLTYLGDKITSVTFNGFTDE